ncbi:MAG: FIG01095692: hypothetical protein [uncultured Sphingomonadaceae bacterium]|uniref:Uncharacterized protein n=1 Tax=uncultured Sphingomonadaceae bacterium TaxID=169976 RepID=A0A6J4THR1_9SPHN|nr:MAG: FIG01095692: hypothetical protein [uncultured Sphingomonadaceae bacterium]
MLLLGLTGLTTVPASAQLFMVPPDFSGPPVNGSEPGIGLPIPGATSEEHSAHLLWNLRSGLNVAALQCQFSPSLRVVDNYNDILAHHSGELATAYTRLSDYFKRVHGAREGQRLFDDYSTKTYNGFSTLYAQLGFCQTAASIGRDAIAAPKGGLAGVARARMREFRNSLVPAGERLFVVRPIVATYEPFSQLSPACYDRKNRLRLVCGGTAK